MRWLQGCGRKTAALVCALVLAGCQLSALPGGSTPTQVSITTKTPPAATTPTQPKAPPVLSQTEIKLLKILAPQADFSANPPPDISIALVETTSMALLKSGQIDFALSVDLDLPIEVQRLDLDQALDPDADGQRFVIIFEVVLAKASRRVLDLKPSPSTVFLGYAGKSFSVAADDPIAGQDFTRTAQNHRNLAQDYLDTAQPLGAPLIYNYTFDKAKIQARRNMSVHTYTVDRHAGTYVKSTFDISEEHHFEVAYGISRYDPKRRQHAREYDTEQDVDDFEKASLAVKLSALLKDYAAKRDQAQTYASPTELRRTLLQDRNVILRTANANTFDTRPLNDPRFDSVVVIYTGKRSLGSGFYVTPDVVMTNWHVVKDHRFVEMKTYDGRETFGTVLGKDARLDVALIRVQNRGRPVAFYTGRSLDIGAGVEAIGHPQGLEFAITRGVISALRKQYSINMPKYAGDKVLYIQTDAPINPGNSGGPLFLGNRVVGMNTWGYRASISEGLAFAIHYSEMMNFMNEHLPGYFVSPAGES